METKSDKNDIPTFNNLFNIVVGIDKAFANNTARPSIEMLRHVTG